MENVKYSPLLNRLVELSKGIGEKQDAPFTAERFILTVINIIDGTVKEEESSELTLVKELLLKSNLDLSLLKNILLESLSKSESELFEDLYLRHINQIAAVFAKGQRSEEITPVILALCIFSKPSNRLIAYFDECRTGAPQSSENSDGSRPIIPKGKKPTNNDTPVQGEQYAPKQSAAGLKREEEDGEAVAEPAASDAEEKGVLPKSEIEQLTAKVKEMQEILSGEVLGQANAINVTTSGYFQSELLAMTAKDRTKPKGTFLFAGPPGVGKTSLAEKFAVQLGLPFKRFDMSEFADKEANIRFAGSDQVYRNSQSGVVTEYVMENPKSVLLFDEIEKAHAVVLFLFYQILDAGTLMDSKTNTLVSFKDTYIIFTTNAGKQFYDDTENGDFSAVSRKVIIKAIQKDVNPATKEPYFPAALCSRFAQGNVVMFNHMFAHVLHEIAEKQITKRAKTFEGRFGIKTEIDNSVFTAVLFAEGGCADARTVTGRANSFFDNEFYELVRLTSSKLADSEIKDIEKIKIGVSLPEDEPEILKLFKPLHTPEVLLFSSKEVADKYTAKTESCVFNHCDSAESAKKCLKKHDIKAIIIDINYGRKHDGKYLNIEDERSDARDFFFFAHENHNSVPVYFIETGERDFDREEIVSFMRKGVKGIIDGSDKNNVFAQQIEELCLKLHQQQSMNDLARANKLVTYETAQKLSADGKTAEIHLFDFKLGVALDPEDNDDILGNMSKPNVRFEDVIGAPEAQAELKYFVDYLKDPRKYLGTGVSTPKGVLLYGPPGTGKTMLAKAMASASDSTFINVEGNKLMSNAQGDGSEKIHKLFRTARKYAPTIIFIDEIDAIAKERTGYGGSEAVLTSLLTEMDGFKKDNSRPVFVLAATNFDVAPGSPKSLDGALMRRFDRTLYIGLPGRRDRMRYLLLKTDSNERFEVSEETLDNIALRSVGMSIAKLENVLELALRTSLIKGESKVNDEILTEAFESYNSGEKKEWDPAHLERTARHEAGHAFLCWYGGETPSYLTIVARSDHGGYMQHGDHENKGTYTKKELISRIRTALAGRASEIVYYGADEGLTTGASGDLENATRVAQAMICSFGMDESFGISVIGQDAALTGELSAEVRETVNALLADELKNVIEIISHNKDAIDALVSTLMQNSYMTGDEIEKTLEGVNRP